jgi:hypothetical protein
MVGRGAIGEFRSTNFLICIFQYISKRKKAPGLDPTAVYIIS